MYSTQGVCVLLTLCVGLVSSFSWDIVVARSNRLEFYNEGTLAHTATPASHKIKWISYDPVHDRVLFTEKYNKENAVSSFDIANQTTKTLIKKKTNRYLKRFAYDPATKLLFGTDIKSIYSFPLGPGNKNEIKGDLVITLETIPREVAVDSCGGYIYWRANNIIERALFDGFEREVIIDNSSNATVQGLTVDSRKIYWTETQEYYDGGFSIESADLDGNNRRTLYSDTESDFTPDRLTVSKDFISWGDIENFFWHLPKNPTNDTDLKPNKIAINTTLSSCGPHDIAANYIIEERTQGVPNCDALLSLLPDNHVCLNVSVFCVHGTKVIGEPRCNCVQGYTGGRCDVSVCDNYCSQGDCNVNAKGQPTCRCNAGYTGGRCDTSVCENYCFQGNCNISAEGQPKCRCNAGYSGMRCDINACHKHCLNKGVCSLNEDDEPRCQCTGQYEGERCDVLTNQQAGSTSVVDGRTTTAMNQMIETTTESNTDVENNTTFTITTDTPTTPQENIDSTTSSSSIVETSSTSVVDGRTTTAMNQMIETTTESNTDVENNTTFTITTDTPTTPQENIDSTTSSSSIVETILLQTPHEGFHWLTMEDGKLPSNAIIGGFEDGNPTYVARAYHKGSLCLGKYVKSTGIAHVSWGGLEYEKNQFEILCGFNAKWVKTSYDNIPKNAFIGSGESLYICRNMIEDSLVCGKFEAPYKTCYLPYKGLERPTAFYEILVEE